MRWSPSLAGRYSVSVQYVGTTVTVHETATHYEIFSGLDGDRLPRQATPLCSASLRQQCGVPEAPTSILARARVPNIVDVSGRRRAGMVADFHGAGWAGGPHHFDGMKALRLPRANGLPCVWVNHSAASVARGDAADSLLSKLRRLRPADPHDSWGFRRRSTGSRMTPPGSAVRIPALAKHQFRLLRPGRQRRGRIRRMQPRPQVAVGEQFHPQQRHQIGQRPGEPGLQLQVAQ